MRKILIIVSLVLLCLPCLASAEQSECSVPCVEPGTAPIQYGCYTEGTQCNIATPTDQDEFQFIGSVGDDIRITLRSHTGCFDPRLEIRDPDGVVILDTWCSGHYYSSCTLCTVQVDPLTTTALPALTKSGSYRVRVSDESSDDPGNYTLQLEKIFPTSDPPGLGYDAQTTDYVDPSTDTDFLKFEGVTGSQLRITLRSHTGCFDPRLEVRDPDGIVILDTWCSGHYYSSCTLCTVQVDPLTTTALPALTKSGSYLVAISDDYADDAGNYEIDLACLYGDCPLCTDNDGDGYGDPASPNCTYPELDCDDSDPNVHQCPEVCTTVADCDDNDACTDDACVDQQCQHSDVNCDDGNPCTAGACDPVSGCQYTCQVGQQLCEIYQFCAGPSPGTCAEPTPGQCVCQ